ncbi:HU family DNA-binding protein [uncultured Halomonas sp.]|uniref:HU family DNA-binding protein n=1 Tax=uncultured Halomonas sp. TaxID=173971 RepID=UPI00261989D6|nr:HU family DNA-binding protein [uncultured Halomonas sp.]
MTYTSQATKKDLIHAVHSRLVDAGHEIKKTNAVVFVDAVLDSIVELSRTHGKLNLRNFGKFEVRRRAPRKVASGLLSAGHPAIHVPTKLALCFTAGKDQVIDAGLDN